ncbi:fluoride efflux transporter CrcB [Bacillus sp. BRMEA1]|uniref:fluoride efflux transporter CrcB n=1 Tax=Neobacillus endophyticus TaxID=2738405 RepID=UPI0015672131|nr:fluoride efflux transporter CrcB [Neobacillus endophyticus]NRD77590.1 fluoride efflux transporter CrcB [Neobacillus endophyticus]
MNHILLVAVGGFFGAISRFGFSAWMRGKYPSSFPLGTLLINLTGSFLLGLIIGANLADSWKLLLGTGFMGAFTTFSTFKLENIQLHTNRNWNIMIPYLVVSYTFGILLAFVGMRLGQHLQ